MLELEVHSAGGLEGTVMSQLEAHEDRLQPSSFVVVSDLCGEGGPAEAGVLCHGVKAHTLGPGVRKAEGELRKQDSCKARGCSMPVQ